MHFQFEGWDVLPVRWDCLVTMELFKLDILTPPLSHFESVSIAFITLTTKPLRHVLFHLWFIIMAVNRNCLFLSGHLKRSLAAHDNLLQVSDILVPVSTDWLICVLWCYLLHCLVLFPPFSALTWREDHPACKTCSSYPRGSVFWDPGRTWSYLGKEAF